MHRNGFTKRMKMTRNNNSEKELNIQSGDTQIQYSDTIMGSHNISSSLQEEQVMGRNVS